MGFKKLKKFLKKVAKPVAAIAAIAFPPLIPAIGSAIAGAGASAAVIAATGAAALGAGASLASGDSLKTALTTGAVSGLTAGAISAATGPGGLFSGAPTAGVGESVSGTYTPLPSEIPSTGLLSTAVQPSVPSTVGAGVGESVSGIYDTSTPANLSSQIASKGLFTGALEAASKFTGLSTDTLGKLGVAGVQTLLSGAAASKTAEKATEAAQIQANAQVEAAKIAAEAAKFRPVGVTTRFGASKFGFDEKGNLTSAGYTPSAEISGYQDRLRTLAGQGLTDVEGARAAYQPLTGAAQNLFSLGGQYLAKSPEQAAADYISKQQALIAPSRQTQLADVQNKLFQQGRTGAAVAQGGNLMATSPELAAYYNALAQQDLTLAAQADQEARDRIKFGSGLFDTGANLQGRFYSGQTAAYQPFATAMDTTAGLERLAAEPLALGTSIGAKTTASAAEAGRLLSSGITSAAATMAPANAYSLTGDVLGGAARNPVLTGALNNAFGVQPNRTYTSDEVLKLLGRG
jgi:hypothetical protein